MSHSVHGSGEWIAHDRRDARIETASATKENHHYANRYLYSTIYLLIVDIDKCFLRDTICPRSISPFYIATNYIKWVLTTVCPRSSDPFI